MQKKCNGKILKHNGHKPTVITNSAIAEDFILFKELTVAPEVAPNKLAGITIAVLRTG